MDPFTLALATFGIQKLRGKSTRTALESAALVGGGSYVLGPQGIGAFKNVGGGAPFSGIQALLPGGAKETAGLESTGRSVTGLYKDLPATQYTGRDAITGYSDTAFVPEFGIKENLTGKAKMIVNKAAGDESKIYELIEAQKNARNAVQASDIFEIKNLGFEGGAGMERGKALESLYDLVPIEKPKATTMFGKAKEFYDKLTPGEKFIGATVAVPTVIDLLDDTEEPAPPFTEEDYKKAYAAQSGKLEGAFAPVTPTVKLSDVVANRDIYKLNTGGIVNIRKFNEGGINYLPSKMDHNENDANNYVRAQGYVEDGSGNGDKDEDTMLAQLADGEFVSRADAVLGAGIMAGASPKNMKEARKKGAAFFYDQQKKFKRIYDLLNASKAS